MNDLISRANILQRESLNKNVYIYEDHRYILNIIYSAFRDKTISAPVTLIYFDRHEDGNESRCNSEILKNYRKELPCPKEFWSMVEWELDTRDNDWLKTGMELGFIKDAILIRSVNDINFEIFENFKNEYVDHLQIPHTIYKIGPIWVGLKFQGCLTDSAKEIDFSPLWHLLGWDRNKKEFNSDERENNIILDFDLDYFTTVCENQIIPWPKYMFKKLFKDENCVIRPDKFIRKLIDEVMFVTIARETDFCGSIKNNNKIIENLDEVIFKNTLNL